jgi:putative ABC transport system permease protein
MNAKLQTYYQTILFYLQDAMVNLRIAKLRSFLAVLGILVGTAAVVALVSSGELATKKALEEFSALGTDLLAINMFPANPGATSNSKANSLTVDQAMDLSHQIPAIIQVAPYTSIYQSTSYQGQNNSAAIIGATPSLQQLLKINLAMGRFISFMDNYSYYCVIGQELYQKLRNQGMLQSPLGQQVRIGKSIFTIIGVTNEWSQSAFFNNDINNSVIIPINTSLLLEKDVQLNDVILQLQQHANIDQVQNQITDYINNNVPGLTVFFRSAKELIKSLGEQQHIFTLLLGVIGSISLLVGGIGVMNIMLVSVLERRREIGIRLAVGAKRKDIMNLFIIEAVTLSLLGGIGGVIVGILVSLIIAYFANWGFAVFFLPPLIGFFVSLMVGIIAGVYPAFQAAKLDPIETLRAE